MTRELHLLVCDETSVARGDETRFHLHGGIVVHGDQLAILSERLTVQRKRLGLTPTEPLKFNTHARPDRVTPADWTAAKALLLESMAEESVTMISQVILDDIASTETPHWAIDGLAVQFDSLLASRDGCGVIIADSGEYQREDLADIATGYAGIPSFANRAPRVQGVATAHVETVSALQLADIAIGALRYCLAEPERDVSTTMFISLRRMLWTGNISSPGLPDAWFEAGLDLRPRDVRVASYEAEYETLKTDVGNLLERSIEAEES